MPPPRNNKTAMIVIIGVVVLALAAFATYWFGFHGKGGPTPQTPTPTVTATGGTTPPPTTDSTPVTMTLWHNDTSGPGTDYWQTVTAKYHAAHPNVTINIVAIQNEDYDTKLTSAMASGNMPDIYFQRGGQALADQIAAGAVASITLDGDVWAQLGGTVSLTVVDGAMYGVPLALTPEGFWYSRDLFSRAGITSTPTTMDELSNAVAKLKAIGVAPISLGAADVWPAAHWFYQFALRSCSPGEVMNFVNGTSDLTDPCWIVALQNLNEFARTGPFQADFRNTPAMNGPNSSAGLIANHKAGMELMGAWEPAIVATLTPNRAPLDDLGFFRFPSVPGGDGSDTALMAGVTAFSCSAKAPPQCVDFMNFLAATDQQQNYAAAMSTVPANSTALGGVADPGMRSAAEAVGKALYVAPWLDMALDNSKGNQVGQTIVSLMTQQISPDDALAELKTALGV